MDLRFLEDALCGKVQFLDNSGLLSLSDYRENYHRSELTQEKYLKQIIENASDLSSCSLELQGQIRDSFTELQLSYKRAQLLSEFTYKKNISKVLEIGCGCGPISRCLGEYLPWCNVVSIDCNCNRAAIAALRTRDLENVNVVAASIEGLSISNTFDIVTSIGFLEHAQSYFHNEDPFQSALDFMYEALIDKGTLLLAIENQFGLKYLIGHLEDYTNLAYEGVQGYPRTGDYFKTFSKQELTKMLRKTGFKSIQYYYPMPDYKLTEAIFSDASLLCSYDLGSVVAGYKSRSYGDPAYIPNCDEQLIWLELSRNRMIPFYANSFFVIASKNEGFNNVTSSWDAVTFSTKRAKDLWNKTQYLGFDTATPVRKRIKTYPDIKPPDSVLQFYTCGKPECWVEGETLFFLLKKKLARDDADLDEIILLLKKWVEYLVLRQNKNTEGVVSGKYLEVIPQNMVLRKSGEIVFIDDEWGWKDDLEIKTIVLRGLYGVLMGNRRAIRNHDYFGKRTKRRFLEYLCEELVGKVGIRDWYHFLRVHIGIWRTLRERPWYAAPIVITGNIVLSERFIELVQFLALLILQRFDAFRPLVIRLRDLMS